MKTVRFEVEGDVYRAFSPNRYISGWERRRRVQAWRDRAWGEWYRAGAVRLTPPVRLTITVHRARATDSDNLTASLKAIQDSLTPKKNGPQRQACLPDDSRRTIRETKVIGDFSPRWKEREWVEILVEEIEKTGE